jgi:hypothetical protein
MHLIAQYSCSICGHEMRVRKDFQKTYMTHVRDKHSDELTPQQMDVFEIEVRKLRFTDLCDDLPESLQSKPFRTTVQCQECQLVFRSYEQLHQHEQKMHPESAQTVELIIEKLE